MVLHSEIERELSGLRDELQSLQQRKSEIDRHLRTLSDQKKAGDVRCPAQAVCVPSDAPSVRRRISRIAPPAESTTFAIGSLSSTKT